jgi:hypothetical protein
MTKYLVDYCPNCNWLGLGYFFCPKCSCETRTREVNEDTFLRTTKAMKENQYNKYKRTDV